MVGNHAVQDTHANSKLSEHAGNVKTKIMMDIIQNLEGNF